MCVVVVVHEHDSCDAMFIRGTVLCKLSYSNNITKWSDVCVCVCMWNHVFGTTKAAVLCCARRAFMMEKGMRCVLIGNFYAFWDIFCTILLFAAVACRLFLEKIYRYHLYRMTLHWRSTKVLNIHIKLFCVVHSYVVLCQSNIN